MSALPPGNNGILYGNMNTQMGGWYGGGGQGHGSGSMTGPGAGGPRTGGVPPQQHMDPRMQATYPGGPPVMYHLPETSHVQQQQQQQPPHHQYNHRQPNGMPPNMGGVINPPPGFAQSFHEPPAQPMGSNYPPNWNIYSRPPMFASQQLETGPETSQHAPPQQQHQSNPDNVWQNPPSSQPPQAPVRDTGIGVWGDPRQQRPIQRWSQPGPSFEVAGGQGYQAPFGWDGVPQEASFKSQQPSGNTLSRAIQTGVLPKQALSLYQQGFRRADFDKLLAHFEHFEFTENSLREVDEFLAIHPRDSISRNNRDDLARKAESIRNEMQNLLGGIFGQHDIGGMGGYVQPNNHQNGYHAPAGMGQVPSSQLYSASSGGPQPRQSGLPLSTPVVASGPPLSSPPSSAHSTSGVTGSIPTPSTQSSQQGNGSGSVPAASRLSQWTKKNQSSSTTQSSATQATNTNSVQQQYNINNPQAAYGQPYTSNPQQYGGASAQFGAPPSQQAQQQQTYGRQSPWMAQKMGGTSAYNSAMPPHGLQQAGSGQRMQQINGYEAQAGIEQGFQSMNIGGAQGNMVPNSPWAYSSNGHH